MIVSMSVYLTYRLRGPDRTIFLPGETSHGHYQIEMACNACHTPLMGVKEQACYDCHATDLKAGNDSHPKNKFTDPRNADRLKLVSADNCVTCHREHAPERTKSMGVTMPDDYCFHCHQQTLKDRPSHRDFAFNSCATAGCHNYHDNTALYEDFLVKHAVEPRFKEPASRPVRSLLAFLNETGRVAAKPALAALEHDAPASVNAAASVHDEWASTAHARAGVNCSSCHELADGGEAERWENKLDHTACISCHSDEVNGFLAGKHGMRLAQNLSPMQPGFARAPTRPESAHQTLTCASCHRSHTFDTRAAAVDSCLSCHNDAHSLAYRRSPHFELWQAETSGKAPAGSGVSCATCHLPRETHRADGLTRVLVQHNQNLNLRPNEKMIRSVCLDCHGLEFSIDALADPALIQTNFIGRPSRHIESIDLALRRQMETRNKKSQSKLNP